MRLGLFLPNWVGDLAMATPALRALRRHFAHAEIVGVLRPYLVDVLAGTHFLDQQLLYDPRGKDPSQRGSRFVRALRSRHLDAAVLFTNSFRTAWLARLSGARRRIGYSRNARGWLLTDRLFQDTQNGKFVPSPVLDDYLRLAYALGCPAESPRIELGTTHADESAADAALQSLGISPPFVAINSSGAFGAAKLWPTEYFAELAKRIVTQYRHDVLVLCGPNEREIARQIVSLAANPRVRSVADMPLSIGLTKACVARSQLMITTDSGPRHFAAAFDVPVITLFGPTHIAWSETHYTRAVHLQHPVDCGPCQQRTCPLGHHRCMRDLSVDIVETAVAKMLGKLWTAQAA
ncbi:MAG: lipopolysaccharide heptosyltransferase II [Pirellulales bacterium]|nr:lipopolysaccharide heptosyltransferase II [Pirellulales bacterium]